MATPTTKPFELRGADGSPLRGEWRTGGGVRPALVLWPDLPGGGERLARAGFAVAAVHLPAAARDVDALLGALRVGRLGPAPSRVALLGHGAGGMEAAALAVESGGVAATVVWAPAGTGAARGFGEGGLAEALVLTVAPPWEAGAPAFDQALAETIRWLATRIV
jgi:pimeloyl-ACP methyl ester carboxylesterase